MRAPLVLSGIGLLFVVCIVTAQQLVQRDADVPRVRLACCLADLENEEFREQAIEELLGIGAPALEAVDQALPTPNLQLARQRLIIAQPGGEIVNGLKIRLVCPNDSIRVSKTVKLKILVCNMTENDMSLDAGSGMGTPFESGWCLRRVVEDGNRAGKEQENEPTTLFISSVNRKNWNPPIVAARSYLEYEVPMTSFSSGSVSGFLLGDRWQALLEAQPSGTHRFRVVYELNRKFADQYQKMFNDLGKEKTPRFWSGKVRSNDVEITVLPAATP